MTVGHIDGKMDTLTLFNVPHAVALLGSPPQVVGRGGDTFGTAESSCAARDGQNSVGRDAKPSSAADVRRRGVAANESGEDVRKGEGVQNGVKTDDAVSVAREQKTGDAKSPCPICLEELIAADAEEEDEEQMPLCKTKCGHWFHASCLENWHKREASCPKCRSTYVGFSEKYAKRREGILRFLCGVPAAERDVNTPVAVAFDTRRTIWLMVGFNVLSGLALSLMGVHSGGILMTPVVPTN